MNLEELKAKYLPPKPEISYDGNAKVLIALTSYNRPKRVQRAIDSVLNQSFQNFHLYVMDNNSSESVKKMLREKYGNHPKITLYFTTVEDEFRLHAWWISILINLAVKWGNEEYISVMTDDEWYEPRRLECMVTYLDKHPEVQICYCSQMDNTTERLADRIWGNAQCHLDHNQVMWRRKLSIEIGGWIEPHTWLPDADFFDRISKHGYQVFPIDNPQILERNEVDNDKRFTTLLFYKGEEGKRKLRSGEIME